MKYLIISVSILFLFVPSVAYGADWYDNGVDEFQKARMITLDSSDFDSTLTGYPLYVNVTDVNIGTDTQADCTDIAFVNYWNGTLLDFEIEQCDSTNDWLEAWVKIPNAYSNGTEIFMYYDDSDSTTYQQNTQGVWKNEFLQVLHLNGTITDSTSNGNDCTNSGSIAVTDEYVGDSREFDGVNDSLECTTVSDMDNLYDSGGSVSAWVLPDTDGEGNSGRLYDAGGVVGHLFFTNDDTGSSVDVSFIITFSGATGSWVTTTQQLEDDEWNHLVLIYDADDATNNPTFVIDGVELTVGSGLTELSTPTGTRDDNSGSDFDIGNREAESRTYDGNIDEWRLYDGLLSVDWAESDWECQRYDGSCITVGAEGTEPSAGGSHSHTHTESGTLTDTLDFQQEGSVSLAESGTISDTLSFSGSGTMTLSESGTLTDDLVFLFNDLNPDLSESGVLSDDLLFLCSGKCGDTTGNNAIVLFVKKDPFFFQSYTDASRMVCTANIQGGVIFNSDDSQLNICDGTNWILPDGTVT